MIIHELCNSKFRGAKLVFNIIISSIYKGQVAKYFSSVVTTHRYMIGFLLVIILSVTCRIFFDRIVNVTHISTIASPEPQTQDASRI